MHLREQAVRLRRRVGQPMTPRGGGEDMENTKRLARKAANANHDANRRLKEAHKKEWLEYYLDAAQRFGIKTRLKRTSP